MATLSPHYIKSNGLAERNVQIVNKQLLRKPMSPSRIHFLLYSSSEILPSVLVEWMTLLLNYS